MGEGFRVLFLLACVKRFSCLPAFREIVHSKIQSKETVRELKM